MTTGFWIILISFLLYGLIHSWLASLRIRSQVRRRFGPSTDRVFRLLYNLIAFITLLPILLLPIFFVDKVLYRIPYPWIGLTIGLQALSIFALLYGLLQTGVMSFLGLRQLISTTRDNSTKFVTNGLYRWVRHPLYTAGLLIIWLFPIMTCNFLALNIGITAYIIIGALLEERKLEGEFGEAYVEYKKSTPMLIPFIRFPSIKENLS
jgi:protein-S-isoprenylcysteine O-methyltransferase Ste14